MHFSWHYVQMGYDPINKLPHIQRMNSLRGDPVNLDGSKINIQDKEVTPDKIKRAVSIDYLFIIYLFLYLNAVMKTHLFRFNNMTFQKLSMTNILTWPTLFISVLFVCGKVRGRSRSRVCEACSE